MKTRTSNGVVYEVIKSWRSLIPLTNNKYRLTEDYRIYVGIMGFDIDTKYIKLEPDGWMTLRAGFESDGPSGPTIDSDNFMRGAWVHDGLYWLLRNWLLPPFYRFVADIIIYLIVREDGMSKMRAGMVFQGVLRGAQTAAMPNGMPINLNDEEEEMA